MQYRFFPLNIFSLIQIIQLDKHTYFLIILHRYNQSMLPHFILFLLYLFVIASQECTPLLQTSSNLNDNTFQIGYIDIKNVKNQKFNEVTVTYSKPINVSKVGVWLSIPYIHLYTPSYSIDFSAVTGKIKSDSLKVVFSIDTRAKWTFARVNFLISNRRDLITGLYYVSQSSLLKGENKKVQIKIPLPDTNYSPRAKVEAYTSISGIKVADLSLSIKIISNQFDPTSKILSIVVEIGQLGSQIELFSISYLLISNIGAYLENATILSFSLDTFKENQLTAMIGVNDQSKTLLGQRNIKKDPLDSYQQAFQIKQMGVLLQDKGTQILISEYTIPSENRLIQYSKKNLCITAEMCQYNGGAYTKLKDNTFSCVLCLKSKLYDEELQKCRCKQSYLSIKDTCICETPRVQLRNQCIKLQEAQKLCEGEENRMYDQQKKDCACKKGYQTNQNSKKCESKCSNGTTYNQLTNRCQCPNNQISFGEGCRKCNILQRWNEEQKKCQCLPNTNRRANGQCIRCSNINSYFNPKSDSCQCKQGYVGDGKTCKTNKTKGINVIGKLTK